MVVVVVVGVGMTTFGGWYDISSVLCIWYVVRELGV